MKFSLDSKIIAFILAVLPAASAAKESFNLLCYTTTGSFAGAELYYKDGLIMISNLTAPSNLTSIYFTRDRSLPSAPWTVSPNTTRSPNPPFGGGELVLPGDDNSTYPDVTVTSNATGSADLLLYGETVFAHVNGSYKNPFYAAVTDDADIWQLLWNPAHPNEKNLTPVLLRTSIVV
ncbi:hypothetical protein CCM_04969 [Cordyceps militaris CM01]|uniref:Uncharacterized protein n=2 Tax=Cordyceps militaris TaxID=73501 RepID=G3JFM0_CORMM|nr:uncharacterized protein CCM_04969 [Cordyceps militaris CM01]ATY65021.1 hypothetical protein A9K55_003840 [Cordyceps militaris]EGX93594.1 hypothetical protein CCM_04969 [Cordyceps militaris CM01]